MKEILPIHSTGTKGVWQPLKPYWPPKQGPRNRTGQLHITTNTTHGRHVGHTGEPGYLPAHASWQAGGDSSTHLWTKYCISVGIRTVTRILLLIFQNVLSNHSAGGAQNQGLQANCLLPIYKSTQVYWVLQCSLELYFQLFSSVFAKNLALTPSSAPRVTAL